MCISWNTVRFALSRTKNKLEPSSSVSFQHLTQIGNDETSYKKVHICHSGYRP